MALSNELPQVTATDTLFSGATANATSPAANVDGYGTVLLFISNGAGSATLTVKGSLDPAFAVPQDAITLGLVKLSDSASGTNTARTVVSGALPLAANTSYLFEVYDLLPNIEAIISGAAGLAGLTVKLYKRPIS